MNKKLVIPVMLVLLFAPVANTRAACVGCAAGLSAGATAAAVVVPIGVLALIGIGVHEHHKHQRERGERPEKQHRKQRVQKQRKHSQQVQVIKQAPIMQKA